MGAGVVICLGRDADLLMAQLMPLPLTVSCFSKMQIGFGTGSPGWWLWCACTCDCPLHQSAPTVDIFFFASSMHYFNLTRLCCVQEQLTSSTLPDKIDKVPSPTSDNEGTLLRNYFINYRPARNCFCYLYTCTCGWCGLFIISDRWWLGCEVICIMYWFLWVVDDEWVSSTWNGLEMFARSHCIGIQ